MAGGVNLGAGQQLPIPPSNVTAPDLNIEDVRVFTPKAITNISNTGVAKALRDISTVNSSGTSANSTASNVQEIKSALGSVGINFSPVDNPLNQYANYTYHIRWFMTNDVAAYNNVDPSNPTADGLNKTIIAESGVTAGFNIADFELMNTCGPGDKTLNSASITWSMTVLEPFGISLLDRIRSAAITQPIVNYMRAPYFIDVWFTGYDEDGKIMAPNLFYQLYRVQIRDMNVDLTEGGSRYAITGIMDGSIGQSNEISMPPALTEIRAKTVGEFFTNFASEMNRMNKTIAERNYSTVEYDFQVPPEIRDWPLRNADVSKQNNRNDDMEFDYQNGTMRIKVNRGTSVENIVNHVVSMSPEADKWVKGEPSGGSAGGAGTDLESNGVATWLMVHSQTKITGWDTYTKDYIRKVTYTLVPYKTINSGVDVPTIANLEKESVQKAKLNFISSKNALKKIYQYIYTGQNTEIIKFDIHVDNLWAKSLPLWEATNTYSNFTQGDIHNPNAIGSAKIRGQYSKQQQIADLNARITELDTKLESTTSFRESENYVDQKAALQQDIQSIELSQKSGVFFRQDVSPGALAVDSSLLQDKTVAADIARYSTLATREKALRYAEDIQSLPIESNPPMPIVLQPNNLPQGQNADQGGDSNKSIANQTSQGLPSGRSFIGSILGNLFNNTGFFNQVDLEIRGDPYWMGQSNIRENAIADSFGQAGSDPQFANYIVSDHMFVLVFRSGENYNEDTGLMQFDTGSQFFNGSYAVFKVINKFKDGSFTQSIQGYKDPFGQKTSSAITTATTGSADTTSPNRSRADFGPPGGGQSIDRSAAAATAAGTSEALVTDGGMAFGGGGL